RWTEGRNMEAFVDLLAAGKIPVQKLISHRFDVDQAPDAYALITGKRAEPFLGVILRYPERDTSVDQSLPVDSGFQTTSLPVNPVRITNSGTSIQLGVLGAGNFATAVLLPAVQKIPSIQRVVIASASGASAQNAARRFGFSEAVSDEAAVLENPRINTVAILTRHNLHARQVQAGLNAGKNVFCEKPLALDEVELDEIAQALNQNQGRSLLMVGFNRRFAPLAIRLKEFIAGRSEPVVAQYRVNAGFIPLNHWTHDPRQGGGRIIGEGCHFIDLLTFLVGQPPAAVSAVGLPDAGRYREDNLVISLSFPDGSLGTVTYLANGDKAFPKERLEVFCGGRVAVLDDFRSLEMVSAGRRQTQTSRLRQDKGHQAEWLAFNAAVQAGGAPPIPYVDLFGVSRASIAAQQALRTGQTIRLPG
ncbi:MAG TPA: Gfo/Idh/MocA family oxidoreductase, partial [Anaerolineales bacterium]|nr:Gfo/Idh/MocA family oxidoreductase [Anaerolineales bacterium]